MGENAKPLTPEQAVRLHQTGNVVAAAAAYRTLLTRDPRNAQLLNLLGVASLQLGNPAAAVGLLRDAVRRQPAAADFHDNLGSALRASGELAQAVAAHRQALTLKPGHPPFRYNLGNALAAMGAHRQAVDEYRQALQQRPQHAGIRFNLANSLRALDDLPAAVAAFRDLLAQDPTHAQAWNNLGSALCQMGELTAAEEAYRAALALRPDHGETLSNLGNVLVERGKLGEAVILHRAAVVATPDSADAHIFLGVALQEIEEVDAAIAAYRQGLSLEPDNIRGLCNLGGALELKGDLPGAEAVLSRALSLDPSLADIWGNLGLCRLAQGEEARAMAAFDRALELDPELSRVRVSRGQRRLGWGELAGGWADYAWRFAAGAAMPDRRFAVPAWEGEALPDRHLLIWREQGIGDELMFATLYRDALARVGRVTIECDQRLVGLFTRSFPDAVVRAAPADLISNNVEPERPRGVDRHVAAGDLCRLLRPSLTAFDSMPYLVPDRRRATAAADWLAGLSAGLRVGVCWRSSLVTHRRRANYLDTAQWATLLALRGLVPVCLQYGAVPGEVDGLARQAGKPVHVMPGLDLRNDLDGVAALIAGLDLVITAPTAVGEIAGAVGAPVWRVVAPGDWSMLGTGVRPWYATMQTFTMRAGDNNKLASVIDHLRRILGPHG